MILCAESVPRSSLQCEHRSAWESFTDRRNGAAERIQGPPRPLILHKVSLYLNEPPSGREVARERETEGARATLEFAQISFCSQAPSVTYGDSSLPEGAFYRFTCIPTSLALWERWRRSRRRGKNAPMPPLTRSAGALPRESLL